MSVSVGYLLIPGMGALGAAVAMSLSIVLWKALALVQVRRMMNFDPSLVGALQALRKKAP